MSGVVFDYVFSGVFLSIFAFRFFTLMCLRVPFLVVSPDCAVFDRSFIARYEFVRRYAELHLYWKIKTNDADQTMIHAFELRPQ